jgi:2-iminobutanoate/2-iminopropanoate deaminase
MTLKAHNPQTPLANYSHGIEVPPNARWLHISGQVAVDKDGQTPERFEDQVQLVFDNLRAVLAQAGMTPNDLVKVNVYLLQPEDIPALRAARDKFQGDARPASTLVIVSRLVRPEWLVEIEAVAAQAA